LKELLNYYVLLILYHIVTILHIYIGLALPLGQLGYCLRPPSREGGPKISKNKEIAGKKREKKG